MLIFRRPNTPHTRVATHRMLSVIRPPELSHGTAESCRIAESQVRGSEFRTEEVPFAHPAGATATMAAIPSGAPDQVVRTVTENCRTLKFTSQGFETE